MAYFVCFSLNLISSDSKKKKNIPKSPNPTYSITKVLSQQFLQQQLCWRLFALPLTDQRVKWGLLAIS